MSALLDVRDLNVRFGGLVALGGVSLTVQSGEIRGLIGPNGAGKTTFFNAVSGIVRQTSGHIHLAGADISDVPAHVRAAHGMRRTFQSVQLLQRLTVLENVLLGMHLEIPGAVARAVLPSRVTRTAEQQARARVRETLAFLGIESLLLAEIGSLPFAQQRLVELARALVARPRLLLLDEPAAGLSPATVEELDRLLRKIRDDWGTTILLVEHVVSLVMEVSDRVTVLNNGGVIAEGTSREVATDAAVRTAYLGEDDDAPDH